MTWIAALSIVVVAVASYASWAAQRLDRLHARVDAAAAALDTQLRVRAEVARRIATTAGASRPAGGALGEAAALAVTMRGLGVARESAESALSRALQEAARTLPAGSRPMAEVADAVTRVSFARRFHNDAVRDALVVRRRWIVRLLHLAGRAPLPSYFEIDDAAVAIADVAVAVAPYD